MAAPKLVVELVDRFQRNREGYRSPQYHEALVRQEFINPFFEELGWDIANRRGYDFRYREVIHEDAIRVGGSTKAPDYSFGFGREHRKFFLEAKKPAVNIQRDPGSAYQLRLYGWNAKLPLALLTNFAEFAIYNCRTTPRQTDKASVDRIEYFTCEDYAEKWDFIAALFSPDAIRQGSFDKYAETHKGKRGTAEVDVAFLAEIEGWREVLAKNIALRNPDLSQRELNFAVQRTIDRIIFLRMCEDRGIEQYGRLLGLTNGPVIYGRLRDFYRLADDRYNSGLFHFHKEKDRAEAPDELTPRLVIDDKVLKTILERLYHPHSPYLFSYMPPEILGQVYEQFLGKVIRLTAGHQAKVEDKPEVKKAGGVYYTPAYIVDYIVKNTVGRLLPPLATAHVGEESLPRSSPREDQGKDSFPTGTRQGEERTPKHAAKLRILDPACGSGSFLVRAYQYLLDWHRDWYVRQMSEPGASTGEPGASATGVRHPKELYQGKGGQWFLTTKEKKRILLNNIYGVDIDAQAVEVTKLSLLLKVLEHESQETLGRQLLLAHDRALPDLGHNIKCGNSLIGPDFYAGQQTTILDDEEKYRINVFDWAAEFPQIMKAGGFDAVIGNPPYGFHQIHDEFLKPYFKSRYVASQGSFEHYFLFYEASLKLLRAGGVHGFIVPVTWLTIPSAASLRSFVLQNFAVSSIAWLPELVFKDAQVNTLVSIIQRSQSGLTRVLISEVLDPAEGRGTIRDIPQTAFISSGNLIHIFQDQGETDFLAKLAARSIPLSQVARPCSGYNPYEVGKGTTPNGKPHTQQTVEERPYHSDRALGKQWKPEAVGRDLGRYRLRWPEDRFIKYGPWLAAARDPDNFLGPRLLVQEITGGTARRVIATYCDRELYHSRDIIPVKCDEPWPSPLFLLGLVNSWLVTWWHRLRNPKANKALFPKVLVSDLKNIPVPLLSKDDPADKSRHDQLVALVEQMLALHRQLPSAKTPDERTRLERQIAATDGRIDRLVYELYGLSEEEIRIVEGRTP